MQIKGFDKATAKRVQDAILAALKGVEDEFGVKIANAGGKFDPVEFTAKLSIKITDQASVEDQARRDFGFMCGAYGLAPRHYGAVVTANGRRVRLIGFDVKRPKYCLRVQDVETGKVTLFTDALIERFQNAVPA